MSQRSGKQGHYPNGKPRTGISFGGGRKSKARKPLTTDQNAERTRLIQEYLEEHGATICPAGYSHMDL